MEAGQFHEENPSRAQAQPNPLRKSEREVNEKQSWPKCEHLINLRMMKYISNRKQTISLKCGQTAKKTNHKQLQEKKKKKEVSIVKVNPKFTIQQERKAGDKLSSNGQTGELLCIRMSAEIRLLTQ